MVVFFLILTVLNAIVAPQQFAVCAY
jgi:hypothetical protein